MHQWVLTVSDVTLADTRPNIAGQRAPLEVQSCNVTEQIEAVEAHWLISVWGGTVAPFKPSSSAAITTSAVRRSNMTSLTTDHTGPCLKSNVVTTATCQVDQ